MKHKISTLSQTDKESLYMQDYSYFREAAGIKIVDNTKLPSITCPFKETDPATGKEKRSYRWGVASVCLFYLQEDGMLQPLAIVIDCATKTVDGEPKVVGKPVTIYNKELNLSEQKHDWPWRYAKTCVQASDWLRHEVTVHL